jgi:hypothetical protein
MLALMCQWASRVLMLLVVLRIPVSLERRLALCLPRILTLRSMLLLTMMRLMVIILIVVRRG